MAQLSRFPYGIVSDQQGNLYIGDSLNDRVRKVDDVTGLIETFAGDGQPQDGIGDGGPAIQAAFFLVSGLAADNLGNLFLSSGNLSLDRRIFNIRIRRVGVLTGIIEPFAGSDDINLGDGAGAGFAELELPLGVDFADSGDLLIADSGNDRIRRVDSRTGTIDTAVAGDLGGPFAVRELGDGNLLIAATDNARVIHFDVETEARTSVVGNGVFPGFPPVFSGEGGPANEATLDSIQDLVVDGNRFFLEVTNMNRVFAVNETGVISTFAGTGEAGFLEDGVAATAAPLHQPRSLAVVPSGGLLIADTFNFRVRHVDSAGIITTVARNGQFGSSGEGGPALQASLGEPVGLAVDKEGNIFVADLFSGVIRVIEAATGLIWTVAGSGEAFVSGDGGNALQAGMAPRRLALDSDGNLIVADSSNDRVGIIRAPLANIGRQQ